MKYGLRLYTPPTLEPVSLAEARAQCKIDVSTDDGLLAGYLLAARTYVETVTGLSLMTQTWQMTIEEWPEDEDCIALPRGPVQSITSVQYYDTANALQTLAAAAYDCDFDRFPAVLERSYGYVWPPTYERETAITIRFVAGYGSNPGAIPEPLRQAILLLVAHWDANREEAVVGNIVTSIPFGISALLAPYRLHGF